MCLRSALFDILSVLENSSHAFKSFQPKLAAFCKLLKRKIEFCVPAKMYDETFNWEEMLLM